MMIRDGYLSLALITRIHSSEHYKTMAIKRGVPLKSGQILQMAMVPRDANWPNAISRNRMGKPTAIRAMMYGIRNAPGKHNKLRFTMND
jgi:hypothetical protein